MTGLWIPGVPSPTPRPRAASFCLACRAQPVCPRCHRPVFARMYPGASKRYKAWLGDLKGALLGMHAPDCWEGGVRMEFRLPRPKSGEGRHAAWPIAGGDPDNLAKGPMDALVAAELMPDDATVRHLDVWREFADDRGPGLLLEWA